MKAQMYFAKGDQIFVRREPDDEDGELFLTVHETTSSVPHHVQVTVLTSMLNDLEAQA